MRRLFEQFNFKKTAQDLGVSVWQTPNFLFLLMGIIIYATIIVVFYMTKDYSDPRILIASECLVVMVMLSTGSSIINRISDIARLNKLKTRFIECAPCEMIFNLHILSSLSKVSHVPEFLNVQFDSCSTPYN